MSFFIEAKNRYELPKLLIREDSPVESFHSSDPQLETLALRGDSPKNTMESFPKLINNSNDVNSDGGGVGTTATAPGNDDLHHHHLHHQTGGDTLLKSPWSHHHSSDLGLNNLELNFLNDDLSDCDEGAAAAACLKKSNSVLKIASNLEINKWQSSGEFDGNSAAHSATSLNFINGDVSSSDDDDAFNSSCELLHSKAKSKSVELNEFRMMFGSSPTLLNFNQVTQTSRLDAVPFQYRRGYTNLNDACLSSSTSDLECFHSSGKKNSKSNSHHHHHHHHVGGGGGVGSGQELSSLLRHRNNGHLDYVRSYENLDRTKIVRMKNDNKRNSLHGDESGKGNISGNSFSNRNDWKFHNHFERERVQEEDSGDDYSYYNLGYDNAAVGSIGSFPIGYQSNESLFNINFDTVEDNIFEINKLALFEPNDLQQSTPCSVSIANTTNSRLQLLDDKCDTDVFAVSSDSSKLKILNLPTLPSPPLSPTQPTTTASSKSNTQLLQPLPPAQSPPPPKKPPKLRCAQCNKKLGVIMIMKCHCEQIFCAQHRYAEAHNCSYNFKSEGKQILARENPKVIAQKLPKI